MPERLRATRLEGEWLAGHDAEEGIIGSMTKSAYILIASRKFNRQTIMIVKGIRQDHSLHFEISLVAILPQYAKHKSLSVTHYKPHTNYGNGFVANKPIDFSRASLPVIKYLIQ